MINPPPHSRTSKTSDDWITPRYIIERLGPFSLDPCASDSQPWPTAQVMLQPQYCDGLAEPWHDFVWLNPPYGRQTARWLKKMATHNNGIALVFARTDTRMFFDHVWPTATALLFVAGRLTFFYPDGVGSRPGHNSGGPSVLIGYGEQAKKRLQKAGDLGAFVSLR